jgi:hypothetical protein
MHHIRRHDTDRRTASIAHYSRNEAPGAGDHRDNHTAHHPVVRAVRGSQDQEFVMRLLDPRFKYIPAAATDVAGTWRRFGFTPVTDEERRARLLRGRPQDPVGVLEARNRAQAQPGRTAR